MKLWEHQSVKSQCSCFPCSHLSVFMLAVKSFDNPVDFFGRISTLLIGALALFVPLNISRLVKAETTQIVVDFSINRDVFSEREIVLEAELLASQTINQQFSQDPALTAVEVVVMANRNGEVMPLLEATVSRDEWRSQPTISAWTRYYNASFELVQRHNEQTSTLIASSSGDSASSSLTGQVSRSNRSSPLIDQLVDSGRLRGESAQEVLSSID